MEGGRRPIGIVAKYIDALSDEQRDRVIEANDISDGPMYFNAPDGCGCLVGVAEMVFFDVDDGFGDPINAVMNDDPGCRFPDLCLRFGKDRIIRACKARAARGNDLTEGGTVPDEYRKARTSHSSRDVREAVGVHPSP